MHLPDRLGKDLRPLCLGTFPRLGFTEKMRVLQGLLAFLETGLKQGAPSPDSESTATRCGCPRGACLSEGLLFAASCPREGANPPPPGPEGSFPYCLAPRLLETVRADPFPRVRRAAVRVMIRLEPPALPGSSIEDYLPGLLCTNAVAACAVLQFIVRCFGPGSVKRVIAYMDGEGRAFPPVLFRLLEGVCESELRGVDPHRVLMQLRGRHSTRRKDSAPAGRDPQGTGGVGIMQGRDPSGLRPSGPDTEGGGAGSEGYARTGLDARAGGGEEPVLQANRSARERFERIRRRTGTLSEMDLAATPRERAGGKAEGAWQPAEEGHVGGAGPSTGTGCKVKVPRKGEEGATSKVR